MKLLKADKKENQAGVQGDMKVEAPQLKTDFSLFYSKFRGSPGTRDTKMPAAASVSKVQDKGLIIWWFSKSGIQAMRRKSSNHALLFKLIKEI